MAENAVINISADTQGLTDTINLLEKIGQVDKKTADEFRASTKAYEDRRKAMDEAAKSSQNFGKQAQDGANKASKAFKDVTGNLGGLKASLLEVGKTIGVVFGALEVINFGKECVKAFGEAEQNALKLKVAVGVNGGLASDFENLLRQSEDLQKITIFSDDDIQRVQTAGLQFGLTATQVRNLIPILTDFASATGQDLQGALEAVISGVNGQERALKRYGVTVDTSKTSTQRLIDVQDQLNKKFQGQAQIIADTTLGSLDKLKNRFDDIKENVGQFISTLGEATLNVGAFILNGFKLSDAADNIGRSFKATAKDIEALNTAVLNVTISSLQAKINSGTGDVEKFKEQLRELRTEKFNIEIKGLTDGEIKDRIKALEGAKFILEDESIQLKALKDESKKRNLDFILSEKELTKVSKEELIKRKANLELLSKDTNNKAIDDALAAINDELDKRIKAEKDANDKLLQARRDASKRLLDQSIKDTQDAAAQSEKDAVARLQVEQKSAEDNARALYETSLKGAKDRENLDKDLLAISIKFASLIANTKIDAAEKAEAEIQKIRERDKKNLQDDLNATLTTIDTSSAEQQAAVTKAFNERGDFSTKAQSELTEKLNKIQTDAEIVKNNEILNSIISTDEEKAKARKSNAEIIIGIAKDEAQKEIELHKDKQAIIRQIEDEAVNATFDIFKQQTENLITALEEQKQSQLDYYDTLIKENQIQFDKREITAKKFHETEKKLANDKVTTEKNARAQINELKRREDIANRTQKLFEIGIATARNIVEKPALALYYTLLGGLEAAAILATPLPRYNKGTLSLSRGSNAVGIDTIPIMANEGEAITPTREAKDYHPTLKAIHDRKIHPMVLNDFVKNFTVKDMKSPNYVSNTTMEIDYTKLASEIAWALRSDGKVKVTNWEGLAKVLGSGNDLRRVRN